MNSCPPYDYFLSYSRDIYSDLEKIFIKNIESYGIKLWIDKTEVIIGSNIVKGINNILNNSLHWKGAIIIIDSTYLSKKWCVMELDFFIKHNINIIPILYKININDIPQRFSIIKSLDICFVNNEFDLLYCINKILDSYLSTNCGENVLNIDKNNIIISLLYDYINTEPVNPILITKADNIALYIKWYLQNKNIIIDKFTTVLMRIIRMKLIYFYNTGNMCRHDLLIVKKSVSILLKKINLYHELI